MRYRLRRQFNELRNESNEQKEDLTKEIEILREKQAEIVLELRNSINEMDNALESIGNKADHMKKRISKLDNGNPEVVQVKEEWELRSKKKKNEENLWELTKSFRKGNIRVTVIPKGEEETEKRGDSLLKEIISETSWTWQGTGHTSPWN